MTTMRQRTITCAVCGQESNQAVITSTNSFGSPDLDLRQPGMVRRTIHHRVQICPYCGYVAADLSEPAPVNAEFLLSYRYRHPHYRVPGKETPYAVPFPNRYVKSFYQHHLICAEAGNISAAFSSLLYAAWLCDDEVEKRIHLASIEPDPDSEFIKLPRHQLPPENAAAAAKFFRKAAMPWLDKLAELPDQEKRRETLLIQKADLLRRSGHFDEVITQYTDTKFSDELLDVIAWFQVEKAKAQDTACYTVEQALDFAEAAQKARHEAEDREKYGTKQE